VGPKFLAAYPDHQKRAASALGNIAAKLHRFRWVFIAGFVVTFALPICALAYFGATGRALPRVAKPVGFVVFQVFGWSSLAGILTSSLHPAGGVLARAFQPARSPLIAVGRLLVAIGALAFMLSAAGLLLVMAFISFGT
jgi:hypothetical protein